MAGGGASRPAGRHVHGPERRQALPPPFAQYEPAAYRRVAALYPCSKQAAAVARGKGFAGLIEVLPLGYDDALFYPGDQSLDDDEIVLGLFGRLVPEKGVVDAVEVLARVNRARPARLVVVGSGPEGVRARARAAALGLADRLELLPWRPAAELADIYRGTHVVLVPSRPTTTWVEQFGRVIVEAQACGAVVAGYASGAIPEVAGEPAILTDVGAVAELGDRVAALASDPVGYADRRAQGIELSRTRTWAKVAARQVDLYRRVTAGDVPHLELPSSPRRRRELARAEFGPTASTTSRRETIRPPAAATRRAPAGCARLAARHRHRARLARTQGRAPKSGRQDLAVDGEQPRCGALGRELHAPAHRLGAERVAQRGIALEPA